ncbi:unnamed protein product [Bursaphelenchus xylophilus]|uniref:(pine wood nematode) hypothetical protein n=1 Tax=Bursaphelenchus xylophilus TaxID=6326 RepID=A0A7I8WXW1_BURXY|nr:unnamed protein product [Bursaphelenchus xylophilus]CAG9100696.1 unnamed protein product [Bursaphelenchus xylophilus]
MATLEFCSFREPVNLRLLINANKRLKTIPIEDYSGFLTYLKDVRELLSQRPSKNLAIILRYSNRRVPWITPKIAGEMGTKIRDLFDQRFVDLTVSSYRSYVERRQLQPFLQELIPALRNLTCGLDDLSTFGGASVDRMELKSWFNRERKNWYLPYLFDIKAESFICGQVLSLVQLYKSRLPNQPKCKSLECSVDMDFDVPPNFYQNVFQEISEAMPKLQKLKLIGSATQRVSEFEVFSSQIAEHILQIAKHANCSTIGDFKVISLDSGSRQMILGSIFEKLKVSDDNVKWNGDHQLMFETATTKIFVRFTVSRQEDSISEVGEEDGEEAAILSRRNGD